MSKAKFEAARELIEEKHYDVARAILYTINHPMAAEWVAKIDAMQPKPPAKTGRLSNEARIAAFIVLIAIALVAVWYFNYTTGPATELLHSVIGSTR